MSNLYEMNAEMEELLEQLVDPETGEVNEEIMEKVQQLESDIDEKVENCGLFIKNHKAFVEALDSEIKSLQKRKRIEENKISRTMDIVSLALHGEKKSYAKVAFSFRRSESVDIVNEEIVPDDLCDFKVNKMPRKKDIKVLLKEERDIPGCRLVVKQNLQVI